MVSLPPDAELKKARFIRTDNLEAKYNTRALVDEGHRNFVIDKVAEAVHTTCLKK